MAGVLRLHEISYLVPSALVSCLLAYPIPLKNRIVYGYSYSQKAKKTGV